MMPLIPVNTFIKHLNYTIFVMGAAAVIFGALLFGFVASTITRPLDNLVAGVKALAAGDFTYSITPRGSKELVRTRHLIRANARPTPRAPAAKN